MTLRAEVSEGLLSGLLGGRQEGQVKLETDPREARMAASGWGGPQILPATWSGLHLHVHLPPRGASDTLLAPTGALSQFWGPKVGFPHTHHMHAHAPQGHTGRAHVRDVCPARSRSLPQNGTAWPPPDTRHEHAAPVFPHGPSP